MGLRFFSAERFFSVSSHFVFAIKPSHIEFKHCLLHQNLQLIQEAKTIFGKINFDEVVNG